MKAPDDERLEREHHPDAIRQRLQAPPPSQNVSDAILGGIDGCITTFAIVSGAFGAGFSATVALVMGLANLIADGFSMAISNFESIKAQAEYVEGVRETEAQHIERIPEGEREEIRQIFRRKGFEGAILEEIVATLTVNRQLWIDTMVTEEYGLQNVGTSPLRGALTTFLAFLVVGAVPLLPFLVPVLSAQTQFVASVALAGLMFYLIGMLKSLVFARPAWRAGLGTLLTGGTAAGLAFLIGHLARVLFDIGAG